jgi:flagellar L-ring protein precursor FlgH
MKYGWIFLLVLCLFWSVPGQDAKKNDKKKKKETKEVVAVPEPTRTAAPPAPMFSNGSLFRENSGNLLVDFKATFVGDLVFIDVIEQSAANVTSNAKRERDSGAGGGLVGLVSSLPLSGAATAASAFNGLGKRDFEGKGETGRTSSLNARIAARVVEVLPNGDLRVEAQKMVKINREDEMLILSGVVRRRDVGANNSIPTSMVGDLRVTLNGKGVASADNSPGWLFRLFEKMSPF